MVPDMNIDIRYINKDILSPIPSWNASESAINFEIIVAEFWVSSQPTYWFKSDITNAFLHLFVWFSAASCQKYCIPHPKNIAINPKAIYCIKIS